MKLIKYYFLLFVFLTSCSDEILDINPTDRITEDAVWDDVVLPRLYINDQYNFLQHGFNNDVQYFGDEAYSNYDNGGYQLIGLNQINSSNVSAVSDYYDYWNGAYTGIRNINIFFSKIDEVPSSDEEKAQLIGEVKFIRAFIYAKLIWNYGGVPIIENIFSIDQEMTGVKRNTYQECVTYILKDLNDAIDILPNVQNGNNSGKASADAARALKTRVLLYNASKLNNPTDDNSRWQNVADAAAEIINSGRYSLYDNYKGLFLGDVNNEVIFERQFSSSNYHIVPKLFAPVGSGGNSYGAPTQNLVDAYEMTNGVIPFINGEINPSPNNIYDAENPYQNRDPRFYANVLFNGAEFKNRTIQPYDGGIDGNSQDASPTGYFNYKFIDENWVVSDQNPYTNPWIYFRLSEIYLIYAEAQFHLGNEDLAREFVNKVRSRPGVDMPDITETGDALFERIVHERYVELAFEGHRFYDLRRWKLAPAISSKPLQGVQVIKNDGNSFSYNRIDVLNRKWDDKLYLIPISLQEIQASEGGLEQNPGY